MVIDHAGGSRVSLSGVAAELAIPAYDGPVDMTMAATMNGQTVKITGEAGNFGAFLGGKVVPVVLNAKIGKSAIAFSGRAGTSPFAVEGDLDAGLDDLAAVMGLMGLTAPDLPEGLGARSIAVKSAVTLTAKGSAHLRGAVITLDNNSLRGDADITSSGPRPKISAKINAGALDFSGLAGGSSSGGGGASAAGWSKETIDVSGFGAMDAEIALNADSVDLGVAKLGPTAVKISNERSRAVFDIRRIDAYGGTIKGQFVTNGRGGLSVGGDLNVAGFAMQPLLTDLAGYDRLIGTGDISIKFLGVGNSMDAIMRGLKGSGRVAFGKGELRGLDLVGMLRNLDPNYVGEGAKTIFDSVTAGFEIADGVLVNDDLKLAAPLLSVAGQGKVGIGTQTLNYRVIPTALAKTDGSGGVKVPLQITGPWAKPKFKLDLESLAKEKFDEERKQAEAAAKAKLEQKLQDELGVVRQDGESLEDAAKRRGQQALEDEAAKALQRLLGGN